MWIPKNEEELIELTKSKSLEETNLIEFKRELDKKNIETAKDISAMTVDGGVICYGIAEDEDKVPCILAPVILKNQAERITQIARNCIDEPPYFEIKEIPTIKDDKKGYILVIIPASTRAPHMVVVKNENRFYGRGPKGLHILTQGEVARLYERREKLDHDNKDLINDVIANSNYKEFPDKGYLHLVAKPLLGNNTLVTKSTKHEKFETIFSKFMANSHDKSIFNMTYEPDFGYGKVRQTQRGWSIDFAGSNLLVLGIMAKNVC